MKICSKITLLCFILSAVLLSGCASNASVSGMTIRKPMSTPLVSKELKENIVVGQVMGGHETNPLWVSQINNAGFKKALETSLKVTGLYGGEASMYKLNVAMLEQKQPFAGLDITVMCSIYYSLVDVKTKQTIYSRKITTPYTAKISEDFFEVTRVQDANEGAARENIAELIKDLYKLRINKNIKL